MPGESTRYINSTRGARYINSTTFMEFMYLTFTCMPDESSRRQLRSLLLYLRYIFPALINSLVCRFCLRFVSVWQVRDGTADAPEKTWEQSAREEMGPAGDQLGSRWRRLRCSWGHQCRLQQSNRKHLRRGIAQWLQCQIHDRTVLGSSYCRSSGRIFFSRVNFLCRLLFQYLFAHYGWIKCYWINNNNNSNNKLLL